mgnify:CR=1 FL=1
MNLNKDCNGDCFGNAVVDDCGLCSGGLSDNVAKCEQDCAGGCGGTAVEDYCGTCDSDPDNDCEYDCSSGILIREYPSLSMGSHQGGSHYNASTFNTYGCLTILDGQIVVNDDTNNLLQANAVACHYENGHYGSDWNLIYSQNAEDPWVATYARGYDGELRPVTLSTISELTLVKILNSSETLASYP